MTEVHVELPRKEFSAGLAATLAAAGLEADVVELDDRCELRVRYAVDERERLLTEVTSTIERWLGDQLMPLVVERANGGCVVRPPAE